jgi:nitrate/TMAO reductase-like tetraheme cytochrome c subunit
MLQMRVFLSICVILFCAAFADAQRIGSAATNSEICFGCHKDQAKDWNTTWHSRSHVDSNPLYKAIVNYMSRITYQPSESILVECAQCHNPKMTIKEIDNKNSFTLSKALNIETERTKKVETAVSDKAIKDGISCNICHNVAKVHESSSFDMRGFKAVEWGPSDTIFGPFEDDGRAGIHKSVQKEHFTDPNKLCMVCHFGGERDGTELYTTGSEYAASESPIKCAECHMSTKREGIISPEVTRAGIIPKVRNIRSHLFEGARNSEILADTIELKANNNGKNIVVELQNLTPHKAPTGFGGRSMDVKVEFKSGNSVIDTKLYTLEVIYTDRRDRETIPYLATKIKSDTRLKADELRKLSIVKPDGATSATITVNYRLASERILKIINFSDPVFDKAYQVKSLDINF